MKRIDIEREYWKSQATEGDIDRNVCDSGLEDLCFSMTASCLINKGKVLEIGCGVGRILKMTSKKDGMTYYGIDISKEMIDVARGRLKDRHDIELAVSDGRNIPYPKHFFRGIYSVAVFQHIDDEGLDMYFSQIREVLTNDGLFIAQFVVGEEKIAFSWQRSLKELRELYSRHGFRIVREGYSGEMPNWVFIYAEKII